jgi:hypothetical protein
MVKALCDPMKEEITMAAPATWGPILTFPGGTFPGVDSATPLQDGRILMSWRSHSGSPSVQAVVLNADGTIDQPAFKVNQHEGEVGFPKAVVLSNGDFAIVYHQKNPSNAYNLVWHRYTSEGISLGETAIQKNANFDPNESVVATPDGGFLISYYSRPKADHLGTGQLLIDAQGNQSESLIYKPSENDNYYSRDTEGLSGGLYVTLLARAHWNGTSWEYSIGFDLRFNGAPTRGFSTISPFEMNNGADAKVVALSTGQFAIVWNSLAEGIVGQIFDAAGQPASGVFAIDSGAGRSRFELSGTSDGGFVIAYGKTEGLCTKIVDTDGTVESSFIVTAAGTNYGNQKVSGLKDGRFLVEWIASNQIKAQIYDLRQSAVDWTGGTSGEQYAGTKFGDNLRGAGGNDKLFGSDGNDNLNGGAGSDVLDGGLGWDLAIYIDSPDAQGGVIIDLSNNSNNGGAAAGDVLIGIESVQGTNQGDTLISIQGMDGRGSELHGAGGNDILKGQNGGDRLYGEAGDDFLEGGAGADRLDGGVGGWDLVTYINVTDQGVTGDLTTHHNGGGAAGDTLTDIESVQGTNQVDTLISIDRGRGYGAELHGAGGGDTLIGKGGGDRLFGGDGDDMLNGDAGDDVLDGGSDSDTAVFSGLRSAYTITANPDGTFTVTGLDGNDRLTNIEWVKFNDVTEALTPGAENHDPDRLTFTDDTNAASVDEDVTAPALGTLKAHDPDTGQTLSYAIDLSDANQGKFTITNGNVLSVASGTLAAGTYTVKVRVSDGHGGALVKDFTIVSNPVVNGNHAPSTLRLNDGTQVSINENALFTGTLSAQDKDNDANLTWSFDDSVAGNGNSLFEIDNSGTGNKILKLKAGIDYEALPAGQKYVTVYLKADDGKPGGTSATQAFTIAVADLDETPPNQAPTGVTLSGHAADEYAMAGREVGTLSATDANNDVLSYALLDDAGGRFMLSGNRILVADGFRLD